MLNKYPNIGGISCPDWIMRMRKRAHEALNDLIQLLSHAHSHTNTRTELVRMLRERANFIELQSKSDNFFAYVW